MKRFILLSVFFAISSFLLLSAQPAEFDAIEQAVKSPDKLLSTEFTTVGSNSIFSVELVSERTLNALVDMLADQTSLKLVSAEIYDENRFKLILTNASSPEIQINEFNRIVSLPWKNREGKNTAIIITSKSVSVTTFPESAAQLAQNLQIAEKEGLKFSGSKPGPEFSSAIFTLSLGDQDEYEVNTSGNEDELAREFENIARLSYSKPVAEGIEYKLEADLSKVFTLIELAFKFNSYPRLIKVYSPNGNKAELTLVVSPEANNYSAKRAKIKALLTQNPVQWVTNEELPNTTVMTGFEADIDDKLTLTGITPKSGMIFSQFFPMVQRSEILRNPFFSRGTYKETRSGRFMEFRVDCDW
ncbi:MAG: hypothetical protein ACQETH_13390 [Candidatus Rifleibacteriota bacterium]